MLLSSPVHLILFLWTLAIYPIPDKFNIVEGGVIVDPNSIISAGSSSVDTTDVVGSFTDRAITVINNSGYGNNFCEIELKGFAKSKTIKYGNSRNSKYGTYKYKLTNT